QSDITATEFTIKNHSEKVYSLAKEIEKIETEQLKEIRRRNELLLSCFGNRDISFEEFDQQSKRITEIGEALEQHQRMSSLKEKYENFIELYSDYLRAKQKLEKSVSERNSLGLPENILKTLDELKEKFNSAFIKRDSSIKEKNRLSALL